MRCKHCHVLSAVRSRLDCNSQEGEVFVAMSRDRRIVRLFTYDRL